MSTLTRAAYALTPWLRDPDRLEIAESVFISQRTVSNHVARALVRLPVRTRQKATELAPQMGWLAGETQDILA